MMVQSMIRSALRIGGVDSKRWWWIAWLGYALVISIPFLVFQAQASGGSGGGSRWIGMPSLFGMSTVLLLSLVLAVPVYFRWKVWASCTTFFVLVGSLAMLRFSLPDDKLGSALGMVFFLWSLFLGFFLGGFFEAVSHLARPEVFSSSTGHGSRRKKNKRKG